MQELVQGSSDGVKMEVMARKTMEVLILVLLLVVGEGWGVKWSGGRYSGVVVEVREDTPTMHCREVLRQLEVRQDYSQAVCTLYSDDTARQCVQAVCTGSDDT